MRELVVWDGDQLVVLIADKWNGSDELVVDGSVVPFHGTKALKGLISQKTIICHEFSDPMGNKFLVVGEKEAFKVN